MSVNTFCNYIESTIISDNNTYFKNIGNINISYIISTYTPNISIRNFIKTIFNSNIINSVHFDEVILHVANILNNIKTKGVYLNNLTCHKLIFISLLLACKLCDDYAYDNIIWSNNFNIKLKIINNMEITILKILNFNLFIIISPQKALSIYKSIY